MQRNDRLIDILALSAYSMRNRVYETVRCPSVCLSVRPSVCLSVPAWAQQTRCCKFAAVGPARGDVDRLLQQPRAAGWQLWAVPRCQRTYVAEHRPGGLLCPRRTGAALSDTAIRPSVCPFVCLSVPACRNAGCVAQLPTL